MQVNDTWMCVLPFVFNDDICVCTEGYLLDGNECINVLGQLQYLNQMNLYLDRLNQSDYEQEQHLINNISAILTQRKIDIQMQDVNLLRNTTSILNEVSQWNIQLSSEIYNVNTSLSTLANTQQTQFAKLKNDMYTVNNSVFAYIQLTSNQLSSVLTTLNTSTKQQFDALNLTLQNANSKLAATENQLNVQQSQINNIINVNSVQSADILTLKSKTSSSSLNGAFWCTMMSVQVQSEFSGYCPGVMLCCSKNYFQNPEQILYKCTTGYKGEYSWYSENSCGSYVGAIYL
ncbi:Hypothetical_protein [Hexamita inflata]|nr:Hypothetical protein HINF_LOCUS7500 [Hexamita inflata]CAI9921061.1 Hypothetical protein HINF_LOCUS8706 [Hexamita inflata]